MEYDLCDLIRGYYAKLTDDDKLFLMMQLLTGLNELHKEWVIHRVVYLN